jgi:hypothetical protein
MRRLTTGPTFILGCGALAILFLASAASANIGRRWWGDFAAEPKGLKGISIVHEELVIDLRPLTAVQPVAVEATYHVHNAGEARKLDLLFIAGSSDVSDFAVSLGDRLLQSRPVSKKEFRDQWAYFVEKHSFYQGVDWKGGTVSLFKNDMTAVGFTAELPSGASKLVARYLAKASGTESEDRYPTATWQLPYILAPAREWESFGDLHVTAYVPEGWQSISSPSLEREGDVLRGSFAGLPADMLIVAVRAPVGPELQQAAFLYASCFVFAVVLGGLMCWGLGRLLGRILVRWISPSSWGGYRVDPRIIISAILVTILWEASIAGAWSFSYQGIVGVLKGQESPYFHEQLFPAFCGILLLMLAVLPLGLLIFWGSAYRSLKRAWRQPATASV